METIIRVDMKHLKIRTEKSPKDFTLLGGRGLSARILNKEVPPLAHPLGHENKLVVAPGLLAGTMAPSFGRISFGAKSPLTYTIKETNAGGTAAQKLDRLGIKALVLEGKPENNQIYCLYLDAKGAQLISSPELEGKKNYELAQILREKYGKDMGIISIGPAGEARMSAASIAVTDQDGRPCRHAGRGGLGAVMGSKGIKAIVINAEGTKPIEPADKKGFTETIKDLVEMLKQDKGVEGFSKHGTPGGIQFLSDLGSMPSWNYHGGPVKGIENLYGDTIAEVNKRRGGAMHGCMPGCVVRCSIVFHGDDGSHLTSALEYETLALLGTNLAITDLDAIARMDRMCDELGIDTIEAGSAIAQLMEAGVVKFGDEQRVLGILEEIGTGGHFGRIVGHGTAFTARYLGLDRVPVVKGQAIPAHDPRACKAVGVTYSTSPMGADHTAGITYKDSLSKKGQIKRSYDEQILNATLDTVGYCMLAAPSKGALIYDVIANLLNARYGTHLNGEDVSTIGLRTIEDELSFNRSAGWSHVHDRVPEFMKTEKLPPHDVVFDVPQDEIDALFKDVS
ncbi:MAG TPA: aldehyde ferredoxin oxidoreductase N-terminal domain-containing protein [Desulfatiglandales bacterium]|nr:aldehyde ferredoxin oxidoreductase N-terminal domain-containing protein [Desulfatiglandales bacterium]